MVQVRPTVRAAVIPLAAALGLMLTAAPAVADLSSKVRAAYEQYGSIPICSFSPAELGTVLKGGSVYDTQYFGDFTAAVQAALDAQAAGACVHQRAKAGAAVRGVGHDLLGKHSLGSGLTGTIPSAVTSPTGAGTPLVILLLAAAAAILVAFVIASRFFTWLAWTPAALVVWRHLWAEAAFQGVTAREHFRDWLRT